MQADRRTHQDILPETEHEGGDNGKQVGAIDRPVKHGHQAHIHGNLTIARDIDRQRGQHDEKYA